MGGIMKYLCDKCKFTDNACACPETIEKATKHAKELDELGNSFCEKCTVLVPKLVRLIMSAYHSVKELEDPINKENREYMKEQRGEE